MSKLKCAIISLIFGFCFGSLQAATSTILIDFGSNPSDAPWINFSNPTNGILQNLANSHGVSTPIDLQVFDAFNGINTSGTTNPDPSLGIPGTASGDSFFGNTHIFSDRIEETGGIRLSGLDPDTEYALSVFASRDASDNRETCYICTGAMQDTAYLNVASNTSEIVFFYDYPSADGTIEIVASPGPNNNNSYGFFYLGALIVEYEWDYNPEPQLTLIHPNGGELWYNRANISWKSVGIDSLKIESSVDNGHTWEFVENVSGYAQKYAWRMPRIDADSCRIRLTALSDPALTDCSESVFSIISTRQTSLSIVVLGSSTAAGTGASSSDSAWVNRYRNELTAMNSTIKVTNLAVGGYTTYHLMPDDFEAPLGKPSPSTAHNITKALSLDPNAIIINLPSNDAANNFSVDEQLANYDVILGLAAAQDIPVWVSTTQPRSLSTSQRANLMAVRDSTFARFGDKAIDFWTDIANDDASINPLYNSGDNVHLNDAGHRVLFERVLAKDIPSQAKVTTTVEQKNFRPTSCVLLQNYPNPFNPSTTIQYDLAQEADVRIFIFNALGQKTYTLVNTHVNAGQHSVQWHGINDAGDKAASGVYFYQLQTDEFVQTRKMILLQ